MLTLQSLAERLTATAPALAGAIDDRDLREPDTEIPVLWAGFVGRALARAWPTLSASERSAALVVVEDHLTRGSELVATAVATGLLEALASEVSSRRLDGPELAAHLGPASRRFLDDYDQFTLGRSTLGPS